MKLYKKYQQVFRAYGIGNPEILAQYWREPHRYYHNEQHLEFLIKEIENLHQSGELNEEERDILLMTAYYHDVIYDPTRTDNEKQSADFFVQQADSHPNTSMVWQMILDTQTHQPHHRLSEVFCALDMKIVSHSSFTELLEWERKIFKEYQFLDYSVYQAGRLNLLEKFKKEYPSNQTNLQHLIDFVKLYKPKIGIYPGSFNPFHFGHLNILEKAEKIFDKVIVARGVNPDKMDINTDTLHLQTLKYRQTDNFSGFLTKYLTSKESHADITLIRGLRNGDDLDYEVNQLRFMEDMKPELKIIFLTCDKEFEHISSSSIKNLDKIDPEFSKKYVPS
ncbi:MAG: adenylyltransferase/cytidyltransferase family protein [Microscillaceae bacterium]|nr:adenylyltransferase/cytidyltransferase family protein [Microscillaceae bacterium]